MAIFHILWLKIFKAICQVFFLPHSENSTQKTFFERFICFSFLVHIKKTLMLGGFHFLNYALEFCETNILVF